MHIKFQRCELKLAHTWKIASGGNMGGISHFPVALVELTAADGTLGLGESAPSSRYQENVESGLEFFAKVNASKLSFADVPGSMRYIESLAPGQFAAKGALNVALLDGAARMAGKPLHDHLGLGFAEGKHVTSFSIGIAEPRVIREKVLAAAAYPILKLKVGVAEDKANLAALREAAPKKPVRVDANEAWKTKEQAMAMIEWLAADGNIQFVEQPMPAGSNPKDLAWLKQRSPLPVFADESYMNAGDVALCADCFHGVVVKLAKTGGVTHARTALEAARKAGLQTMLGCMIETSVLISAAAHLADLTDHLDLDGNLLIANDPFEGVAAEQGVLSFTRAREKLGLQVHAKA